MGWEKELNHQRGLEKRYWGRNGGTNNGKRHTDPQKKREMEEGKSRKMRKRKRKKNP